MHLWCSAGCWHSYWRIAAVLYGSCFTSFRRSRWRRTRDREFAAGKKRSPIRAGQLHWCVLVLGCYSSVISISGSVSVGFWLKTAVPIFHGFSFFVQKMSIALHITFVENDQSYYFASNHTPDGQHCYVQLFIYKLAVYVMQLLHIKTKMTFRVTLYSDWLMMW